MVEVTVRSRGGAICCAGAAYDIVLIDLDSLSDLVRPIPTSASLGWSAGGRARWLCCCRMTPAVSAALAAMRAGAHDCIGKTGRRPAAFAARIGELAQRHGKARALTIGATTTGHNIGIAGFVGSSSQMPVPVS